MSSTTTRSGLTASDVATPLTGSAQCAAHYTMMTAGPRTSHARSTQKTSQRTSVTNRGRCGQNQSAATNECLSLHSTPSRMQRSDRFNSHSSATSHNNANDVVAEKNLGLSLFNTAVMASDLAQGERVTASSLANPAYREREQQAWQSEMSDQHQEAQSLQPEMKTSEQTIKKSALTYRTVLAKRGLLVKDTLGAGSYSKVKHACYVKYVDAENPPLYPNDVAVKIIDRTIAPKDFQQKFLPRELEIWPQIRHENIVRMLQWFSEGHRVYMILEYVEGGDALKFIQNKGAVSEATGKKWTRQVAESVNYLHDLDVTHRDLKLENLLIDRHDNIKLCDFGFVKRCTNSDLSKTFCGSKSYAAPEILKGERYPPKKADIWAIGVILFILVTGRMPFDETKGNASLLEEHRKLDLQWPKGRRAVSAHCKSVSAFCLKFQWCDRPSVIQLLNHPWFHTTSSAK